MSLMKKNGVKIMPKKNLELSKEISAEIAKIEPQEVEIIDSNDFELITMQEYQVQKNLLAERRKAVVLRLDGRKLSQANKIIDTMDKILEEAIKPGLSAMDQKFLADAYDKWNKTLNTTIRLDTVDGGGKAARLALEVQFGNGTSVKTVVEG